MPPRKKRSSDAAALTTQYCKRRRRSKHRKENELPEPVKLPSAFATHLGISNQKEADSFSQILIDSKSVIAGSLAMHLQNVDLHFDWQPNDCDIFVFTNQKEFQKEEEKNLPLIPSALSNWLRRNGWSPLHQRIGWDPVGPYFDGKGDEKELFNPLKVIDTWSVDFRHKGSQQRIQVILLSTTFVGDDQRGSYASILEKRFDIPECSIVWPAVNEEIQRHNQKHLKHLKNGILHINFEMALQYEPMFSCRVEKYCSRSRGFTFRQWPEYMQKKKDEEQRKREAKPHPYESLPCLSVERLQSLDLVLSRETSLIPLLKRFVWERNGAKWIDLGVSIQKEIRKILNTDIESELGDIVIPTLRITQLPRALTDMQRMHYEPVIGLWQHLQIWIHTKKEERDQLFSMLNTWLSNQTVDIFTVFAKKEHRHQRK